MLAHKTVRTMTTTSRLYDALNEYLGQCQDLWKDIRHLQTQSHQRRFRRWLSNRRINILSVHHRLITQALAGWEPDCLYLSLDTHDSVE